MALAWRIKMAHHVDMDALSQLTGISSMAARQVLAELLHVWQADGGAPVLMEAAGGVEVAQRVSAGTERFDLVFLASEVIDQLIGSGRILAGSKVDVMRSPTVVAVASGEMKPAIDSEASVRDAVLAASAVGLSTGPSGRALRALFARWGIAPQIVEAPPGVPVGQLLAEAKVSLGFQQLSELMQMPGIEIIGKLPSTIAVETVFSAGIVSNSDNMDTARALLAFLASPAADAKKRAYGMQAVAECSR